MKSKWGGARDAGEGHSPVEMRFIDMFMTAIGSLVFVAIVLIVVLPRMTETKKEDEIKTEDKKEDEKETKKEDQKEAKKEDQTEDKKDDKKEDNKETKKEGRAGSEDIYILRKWFSVQMVIHGCQDVDFELYVRADRGAHQSTDGWTTS